MRTHILIAGAALILISSTGLVAEQYNKVTRVTPPVGGVHFSEPYKPASNATRVVGTVIDIRQVPVAHAKVHLRDLTTGSVLIESDTNDLGEYVFDLTDPGTYVVEMVMPGGDIVALSNAGSLARYETLNTVVMLPGRWDSIAQRVVPAQQSASFLGIGAQTTMTSTTMQLAAEQEIRPIQPGEAVSSHTP